MIDECDSSERGDRLRAGLAAVRWTAAAAAVVAVHGAAVWLAINWRTAEAAPNEPPPAVMIDLAPLPVAPPAPPEEVAPGQQMTEAQPLPTPDAPTPVEDAKPDPAPPVETQAVGDAKPDPTPPIPPQTVQDVKPDSTLPPAPEPDVKVPDLPKKDDADAVLAPPPPPPPPIPKGQKKPPPKPHEVERKKPVRPDKKVVRQTTAPPTSEAQRSEVAAAPAAGASFQTPVSPATWKGELMAHLNRYKRYPAGATGFGTASISFAINRSGEVLSARLIGSSGDWVLDAEAVGLARRASPVPPPPPGIGGGVITLTVPVRFDR